MKPLKEKFGIRVIRGLCRILNLNDNDLDGAFARDDQSGGPYDDLGRILVRILSFRQQDAALQEREAITLVLRGANPRMPDYAGFTAMTRAAQYNFTGLINVLGTLDSRLLHEADGNGQKPLTIAENGNSKDTARQLRIWTAAVPEQKSRLKI